MKLFRILTVAAFVAALFVLVGSVSADCPDEDPRCTILPPVSQEVSTGKHSEALATGAPQTTTLNPLDAIIPMPPPPMASKLSEDNSRPAFERLSLPLRLQDSSDPTCGVQALGMALDGLGGSAPSSSSLWTYLENQGMTYAFGTGVEELAHAAQSFGYAGSLAFHNASLADLIAELEAGRPVVLSLGANGEGQPGHFVALTGISPDGAMVSYNDPTLGQVVVAVDEFLRLWDAQGNSGVRVAKEALATAEGELNLAPWVAMAAGLMALVSTTPMVLGRRGIGGMLDPGGASGGSIGDPPYQAPPGFRWVKKLIKKYKTVWEQDGWSYENRTVPRYEKQRVQVGMTTVYDKIPQYKTVRVQDGWKTVLERVPQYKTVRYVKYYRTTRERVKRYRYYRGRRYFAGYSYITKRTPVYGSKTVFNGYKKVYKRVPNYVEKRVLSGYKVVESRVPEYEWREVQVGWTTEKVRVPKMVQVRRVDGVEVKWKLEKVPDPLDEAPVAIEDVGDLETTLDLSGAREMQTTNPLRIRSEAGMDGTVLCYAVEDAPIYFTGEVHRVDGVDWYQVKYQDPNKGTVVGWVSSKYLRDLPSAGEQSSQPIVNLDDPSYRWYHLLSPAERADYLQDEIQKFDDLVAEVERLLNLVSPRVHRNIPLGLGTDPFDGLWEWQAQVRRLLSEPEWLKSRSMPPGFGGEFGLNSGQTLALRALISGLNDLKIPISESTLAIIGDAFGIGSADVLIHGLQSGPDYWHSQLSTGDLPVTLHVFDRDGVRLRVSPYEDSALVVGPFDGIPYNDTVIWAGKYEIGVDEEGHRRVYYQVSFEWAGRMYEGWVPSEYFSPIVERESGRPESSGGFRRTYGYDQDGGWDYYHAGGAAQNLNVQKIFEEMGYEFGDEGNIFTTDHKNLCGQLAVMEALGVPLEEGFRVFANLGNQYRAILQNPDRETFASDLERLFRAMGKPANTISDDRNLSDELSTGKTIIALVAIKNGQIQESGSSAHWVHVVDYNEANVTIFNPYFNREETISTQDFNDAWASTPGNSGSYTTVVASP